MSKGSGQTDIGADIVTYNPVLDGDVATEQQGLDGMSEPLKKIRFFRHRGGGHISYDSGPRKVMLPLSGVGGALLLLTDKINEIIERLNSKQSK